MSTPAEKTVRELDRRTNDGFDVRLLWYPRTDRVFVVVEDHRHGGSWAFDVDASDALDAFHHPFAYVGNDADAAPMPVGPCSPGAGEQDER